MPTLLIVDDEQNVLYSIRKSLKATDLRIVTAETAKQGLDLVLVSNADAVLLDVRLPDMSGLDAFDHIRKLDPRLPVIIMTAHATTETAIEAMKRGAFEYLIKPLKLQELRDVVARAIELSHLSRVPAVFDQTGPSDTSVDRIVGVSPQMQKVYKDIGRVAGQDVNVLILGESGTGKELVARAIYQHSNRSGRPFLAINAAAIPETLLESELFGHERGAFTGADRRRIGKFEQAHQGTLFLDEIGDMSMATQAKVLRVLQDGRFERVGGNETIQTDVRVIAATNQNLEELIGANRFRQDLYYRLKVYTIAMPPLRARSEDLRLLLDYFLTTYNRELGKNVGSVSPEALDMLARYPWPGNVRELQSAVKYALVNSSSDVLTVDCFPESCRREASPSPTDFETNVFEVRDYIRKLLGGGQQDIHRAVHLAVDHILFQEVLKHTKGNQLEASKLLGISRTTLRAKLESLGITIEKQVF